MTENEITNLTPEEEDKLFQLYLLECAATGAHASPRDFVIWLQER